MPPLPIIPAFWATIETFYRSLSANNYKKYSRKEYEQDGGLAGAEERKWTFIYDDDGYINFDKY